MSKYTIIILFFFLMIFVCLIFGYKIIFFYLLEIVIFYYLYFAELLFKIWNNYILIIFNFFTDIYYLNELNLFSLSLSLIICSFIGLAISFLSIDIKYQKKNIWIIIILLFYGFCFLLGAYSTNFNIFILSYIFLTFISNFLVKISFPEFSKILNSFFFSLIVKLGDIFLFILIFFFTYFSFSSTFIYSSELNSLFSTKNPNFFFLNFHTIDLIGITVVLFSFLKAIQFSFYFMILKKNKINSLSLVYFLNLLIPSFIITEKMYLFIKLSIFSQKLAALLLIFFIFWFIINIHIYINDQPNLSRALEFFFSLLFIIYHINSNFGINVMFLIFLIIKLILFLSIFKVIFSLFWKKNWQSIEDRLLFKFIYIFSFIIIVYSFVFLFFYLNIYPFYQNYYFLKIYLIFAFLVSVFIILFFIFIYIFSIIFFYFSKKKKFNRFNSFIERLQLILEFSDIFLFFSVFVFIFFYYNYIYCITYFDFSDSIIFKFLRFLLQINHDFIFKYIFCILTNCLNLLLWWRTIEASNYKNKIQYFFMVLISVILWNIIYFTQIWPPK